MKYAIVYSSKTGNTKLLADTIKEYLKTDDCIYCGLPSVTALAADIIYVGFWTDKGRANQEILDFLTGVKDKNLFIFGTCGYGKEASYFDKILKATTAKVDSSNRIVGSFVCQGKMPMSIREKYVEMKKQAFHVPNIDQLIENFDQALSHPDLDDLINLQHCLNKH